MMSWTVASTNLLMRKDGWLGSREGKVIVP